MKSKEICFYIVKLEHIRDVKLSWSNETDGETFHFWGYGRYGAGYCIVGRTRLWEIVAEASGFAPQFPKNQAFSYEILKFICGVLMSLKVSS